MKNKDKKLEKLQKVREIEAKLGNRKLADSELKTLFAHADKKKAEIEALERERMETLEFSLLLEENYLEALRKIYQARIKGVETGSYRKPRHFVEAINQRKALRKEDRTLFSNIKEDALTNEIKIPPIIGVSLTK